MLYFLLKSQDKVETLEPEALVMFISRTYFFLTAEIILIYVILEITFWSGSSDFNWYLYIHVYWDSLSMQMFLTFISFLFRFYFSISSMLYDIQVLIVQLSYICTPWAIYEPVVHHLSSETQSKKEEIGILITSNYKYCIKKEKKESHKILNK